MRSGRTFSFSEPQKEQLLVQLATADNHIKFLEDKFVVHSSLFHPENDTGRGLDKHGFSALRARNNVARRVQPSSAVPSHFTSFLLLLKTRLFPPVLHFDTTSL